MGCMYVPFGQICKYDLSLKEYQAVEFLIYLCLLMLGVFVSSALAKDE